MEFYYHNFFIIDKKITEVCYFRDFILLIILLKKHLL